MWFPVLEAAEFELVVRESWWQEHRCLRHEVPRCNLHVFSPDAAEPIRHRIFRDWLREHPRTWRSAARRRPAQRRPRTRREHVMDYNARKEPVTRALYDRAFRTAGLL